MQMPGMKQSLFITFLFCAAGFFILFPNIGNSGESEYGENRACQF